jgi:hypothetical protein
MCAIATSIAPMLSVRNGAQAVEFYRRAFGATAEFRIDGDGGSDAWWTRPGIIGTSGASSDGKDELRIAIVKSESRKAK